MEILSAISKRKEICYIIKAGDTFDTILCQIFKEANEYALYKGIKNNEYRKIVPNLMTEDNTIDEFEITIRQDQDIFDKNINNYCKILTVDMIKPYGYEVKEGQEVIIKFEY